MQESSTVYAFGTGFTSDTLIYTVYRKIMIGIALCSSKHVAIHLPPAFLYLCLLRFGSALLVP